MIMNFDTILDTLRHTTVPEFFVGAYVKEPLSGSFNPALDKDTRPRMIITSFGETLGSPHAKVVLDSETDSNIVLIDDVFLLADIEISDDIITQIPTFASVDNSYWKCLGYHHSLLKLIKLTDDISQLDVDLVSTSLVLDLTIDDLNVLNISISEFILPINLSSKPLEQIDIIYTTLNVAETDVQEIYAKLTPIDSTDNEVEWSITSVDQAAATLTPDIDTRICNVLFNTAGTVTIMAKSVAKQEITHAVTFVITA